MVTLLPHFLSMNHHEQEEIQDTINKVLAVLREQYVKAYWLALVKYLEMQSQPAPSAGFLLIQRPKYSCRSLKEGWIYKRGTNLKMWYKRYLVVRSDYVIDSYENEEDARNDVSHGKHYTKMNLCGYAIVEDPNEVAVAKRQLAANQIGVDVECFRKPKNFPLLTFGVYHNRRECKYFKTESPEEFRSWVTMFKRATVKSRALTWADWCHERAFPIAIRKTRWEFGKWGLWRFGGSEEEVICDLIVDELENDVTRLCAHLHGPVMVRDKLRKGILKTIDNMIVQSVRKAWESMKLNVMEERPRVEATLRSYMGPHFVKAKDFVSCKMKDAVVGILDPLLKEHVTPVLGAWVSNVLSPVFPMRKAIEESLQLFDEMMSKLADDPRNYVPDFEVFMRAWDKLHPSLQTIDSLKENSFSVKGHTPLLVSWELLWTFQELVFNMLDSALYTWRKSIEEGVDPIVLKEDIIQRFRHDSQLVSFKSYCHLMREMVMPSFETRIHPAAYPVLETLENLIPGHRQQFLDVREMFEEFYNEVIDKALQGAYPALDLFPKSVAMLQ